MGKRLIKAKLSNSFILKKNLMLYILFLLIVNSSKGFSQEINNIDPTTKSNKENISEGNIKKSENPTNEQPSDSTKEIIQPENTKLEKSAENPPLKEEIPPLKNSVNDRTTENSEINTPSTTEKPLENQASNEKKDSDTNLNQDENQEEFKPVRPRRKGILVQEDDPEGSKRWAIVIGVNDYNDVAIADLSKARNDAKIMAQILKEQGEFENVFLMTDDLGAKSPLYPTRINIEEKLDNILSFATQDDTILFFFSGHGISDSEGNGFILPVDTVIEKPTYTAVSVNALIDKVHKKNIKKSLFILDACRDVLQTTRSGNNEGLQSDKFQNAEVGATFFSTKSGYYSFEDPKSDFGVFTKYMAYGLEGKADINGDGIVSLAEIEEYVQKEVSKWSLANNKKQKPFLKFYREKYGDLPITVKGTRKKSLVDDNNYNPDMTPFLWRSALVPGWGQWNKKQKYKASYFFGSVVLGLFYMFGKYSDYNKTIASYNESSQQFFLLAKPTATTNAFGNTGLNTSLYFYSVLTVNQQKKEIRGLATQLNVSAGILFLIYIYNLGDAYFGNFNKVDNGSTSSKGIGLSLGPKSNFSFDMDFQRTNTHNQSFSESRYLFQFERSF